NLARAVVLRLAGKNDKAVRQLELTYGGGKTHTLITLRHLVHAPAKLPDVPAVNEFQQTIDSVLPEARVTALCFDKVDVEVGCDVRAPDGQMRRLVQPWSILAYQLAGESGLKLLHPEGQAQERRTPPAEPILSALLALPAIDGQATLVLLDEVLLYAKVKVRSDPGWLDILSSFFQYLTQAAAKVNRCCVVASLLSSEPKDQADELGKRIVSELYDIFQRQREEAVQPVEKSDVAEVLRRRLFDTSSLQNRQAWRQHVIAAVKGIAELDEQTGKGGKAVEEHYLESYPFHPELTEVFYSKWSAGIERFQKTRGVLRTFALALREAEKWDESPLIGPAVFLNAPQQPGLSESARELVAIADTASSDGQATRWTGVLEVELGQARQVEEQSVGLRLREIQQAVMATFLHSQPPGRSARTRDLLLLVGPCRPDKIELEKALARWVNNSHWLDDSNVPQKENGLPAEWRLGNRPNLTQMHAAAAEQISTDVVQMRLLEEIPKVKALTSGASAAGVRVHTLPARPSDIEDDGLFHYVIMPPSAASDSGKPSTQARRHLDEKTGPENPRVFRNAVLLLCPSRDGLEVAQVRVREYLAWEKVKAELAPQNGGTDQQNISVDVVRMQTLAVNISKARGRIPEAIRQAWCVVVTVSDKNEVQAFKITVTDEPLFETVKNDSRARVKDTAITADALLPDGPYNLWRGGETSRRVKDLAGAFAQLPHLPKMLKSQAILETLLAGCLQGTFVLRLMRPDRSFRTWWRARPDEAALGDAGLELVLPAAAQLSEIPADLLIPGNLPSLWKSDEITMQAMLDYFSGQTVVQVDKGGYREDVAIPKAAASVVDTAVNEAVAAGKLWLLSGPASILAEPIPTGILVPGAMLRAAPAPLSAVAILPENLPAAWKDGMANGLAIATALSQQAGRILPWRTVRDVIAAALQARFATLSGDSGPWPCDFPGAQALRFRVAEGGARSTGLGGPEILPSKPDRLIARADFEPSEIQDLADAVPLLLALKARTNVSLRFHIQLEVGDDGRVPSAETLRELNTVLEKLKTGFRAG
ncbi:MAG: DUF499 domain-containing protein, partial [Phycisphaerae bacterium]